MRHRIALQKRSTATDDYGEPTELWTNQASVWASIEPANAREREEASRIGATVTHNIEIRTTGSIVGKPTPEWRIQFGSRIFQIVEVRDLKEMGHKYALVCREEVA